MNPKKTNHEIVDFMNAAAAWQNTHKDAKADTKFNYALKKMVKTCQRLYEKYQQKTEDINLKFAATDAEQIVLRDERGNYRYKKDDAAKRLEALRALQDDKVEVTPFYVDSADIPKDLEEIDREPFLDFVIKQPLEVVQKSA